MRIKRLVEQARKELSHRQPRIFKELVRLYKNLIISFVDDEKNIDEELKQIGGTITECWGHASDGIKIHTQAMSEIMNYCNPFISNKYIKEANFKLLQLLGCIAESYRKKARGYLEQIPVKK